MQPATHPSIRTARIYASSSGQDTNRQTACLHASAVLGKSGFIIACSAVSFDAAKNVSASSGSHRRRDTSLFCIILVFVLIVAERVLGEMRQRANALVDHIPQAHRQMVAVPAVQCHAFKTVAVVRALLLARAMVPCGAHLVQEFLKWSPCQDHAKKKMREPVFSKSDFVEA